ncbi:MAG: DEAD/DEAH box helicase family protein [Candidatus Nanopelagicaceae bacterium]|nr:DEAD/DEAH box helicase family protein [Candidatus Nanopelagicaceae bacterium]
MMVLTHPFRDQCDAADLLDDCNCLSAFCGKLEYQAGEKAKLEIPDAKMEEQRTEFINKFKGDGLECLVEFIIKKFGTHPHIGISDYELIPVSDDTGVDGKGKSALDGKPVTVQVKYRQANHLLTANGDHLTNFAWTSVRKFGVDIASSNHMLIFTTAEDVHHFTQQEMLDGAVKVLNRQALRELTDQMQGFWSSFKEALLSSRTERAWVKPIELREHQLEAVAAVTAAIQSGANKGIVELPTGTGKTLVQAGLIAALEGKE